MVTEQEIEQAGPRAGFGQSGVAGATGAFLQPGAGPTPVETEQPGRNAECGERVAGEARLRGGSAAEAMVADERQGRGRPLPGEQSESQAVGAAGDRDRDPPVRGPGAEFAHDGVEFPGADGGGQRLVDQ